jgi:DNA-binding MarR family transcriptional regulator
VSRSDGPEKNKSEDERRIERKGFFAPHGSGPADCAMGALMMTAKMIHRFAESRISKHKKFNKLSGPRMGVLFIVHHHGGIRMGDLAAKLHVAPRTVTDLVDGLERDGFLHRVPDPSDRRASILELSALAKKDVEHIASMRTKFVEEIFSPLSNDEKDTLVALLNKLSDGPIRDLLSEEI